MRIEEQRQGAVLVVRPRGPLTAEHAPTVAARLREALTRTLGRFVVDASDVPFVDSGGLEMLLEVSEELSESGLTLRLCGVNETLREVLDLTGVGSHLEQFADSGDAVRSFL